MTTKLTTDQLEYLGNNLATVLDTKLSVLTTYSTTWDPPALAAGASASTSLTVAGAAQGNIVLCSLAVSHIGCSLTAHVSAAGTVSVLLHNTTAGTINLSPSALRLVLV